MSGAVPPGQPVPTGLQHRCSMSSSNAKRSRTGEDVKTQSADDACLQLEAKLEPFGGWCWWCWMCSHEPSTCPDRQNVLLPDFQQLSPSSSLGSPAAACLCKGCTGLDTEAPATPLSASAIKTHNARRNTASKRAHRITVEAAQQELLQSGWAAAIRAPFKGTGPFGAFSVYHLLVIEFVLSLPPFGSHRHTTGSRTSTNRAA